MLINSTKTFIALVFLLINVNGAYSQSNLKSFLLPQFTQSQAEQWINSPPLHVEQLRGKVILIDVWTFDCWNCYRSIPWLNSLEEKFSAKDFIIIGIHTPEFEHEHQRENVLAKVKEFKLHHPVMMDNDFAYWKALNNKYWPAFYLVNKKGEIQKVYIGETHSGDQRAKAVESHIEQLIAE